MLERIGPVKNPLTIVAIFAGLAEVSGTLVLPWLCSDVQSLYVWFLMFFPVLLVFLFFITLLWKHHVLYAPSDFKEERTFLDLLAQTKQYRLYNDYEEEKALDLMEKSKELVKHLPSGIRGDAEGNSRFADLVSNQIVIHSSLTSNEFKNEYFESASKFEDLIAGILRELNIDLINFYKASRITSLPDFIAIRFDGKRLPIEVKYYTKALVPTSLAGRIVKQMVQIMDDTGSDESILIISSDLSEEARRRLTELPGDYKIHIVRGSNTSEIKPQIKNIFTRSN